MGPLPNDHEHGLYMDVINHLLNGMIVQVWAVKFGDISTFVYPMTDPYEMVYLPTWMA